MKKALAAIYRALCDTSLVFGAIVLFFAIFMIDSTTANLSSEVILNLFYFSAVFGITAVLMVFPEIPEVLAVICRFLVASAGFVLFVLIPFDRPSVQIFVGTALFVLVYWILFALFRLITIPFRKKESQE